ncbi:uncharacterized protein ARMOST_20065 [Armillaria ostoyae]|uniref:Uncharacterized protein n=1 Tax=Armillaria ostoyae TaxID=47428 RepID=A0A284S6B0_ARMOS|nr:uncharacterized protein ARMOST_20065 [Armillaria ostoyae]
MSAPTKGRKPGPGRKGIIKHASPTAALTLLKEHNSIINNSKVKLKILEDSSLPRKNSVLKDQLNASKCLHVSAPDSPGAAWAKKTIKMGSNEDQAASCQKATSLSFICPSKTLKKTKQPLPVFDEYSSDEAMPVKQEPIIIDSESEEDNPFASISKAPINDLGEGSSKKDVKGKGKEILAPPIEKPTPKKKGTEKKPKKRSQEFINEMSGPEVSQHMSGSHILILSGFMGNPEATVYYTAVGAGSVTAVSHAAMHSLHIQLLSLQDSMHRTVMEEEHLKMDLTTASHPTMHFPCFLPDCLNDLSSPLHLLDHFHQEEVTQYASNVTLSLFTIVHDAARDKKKFQVPIVVPMQHSSKDLGEGSSTGLGTPAHNDRDEEDGHNSGDDDRDEEDRDNEENEDVYDDNDDEE